MRFISHDLAVVEYICDAVIVLYLGRIMGWGQLRISMPASSTPILAES